MKNLYLSNYHDQRWDWTRSAVTKFRNGFKRFDGYGEDKEQVYIGVYGPTQVGKTTFILTLLGIEFDRIQSLSDALRGRRAKGKSATITCTIFTKANDANFQITWPSGQKFTCSTLKQVEEVMFRLRNEIYREEPFSLAPLRVEIPGHYFNQSDIDRRVRDLAIIDLPGDDSKDHNEMHHVNRVLKEYLSRCKVCIIMEIASQMTNLTKLDKEFIKDWMALPEQFRILLTRSVTNGSVMRSILDGQVSTVEEFKTVYRSELNRVSEMDDVGTAVYPLEFGDSWTDLQQAQPDPFHQTNQWIQAIFTELVEDLTQIDSPEQAIRKIKSMEHYIVTKQQKEVEALEAEKNELVQELEEQEWMASQLAKKLESGKEKIVGMEAELATIGSFFEAKMPPIFIPSWPALNYAEKKASYLSRQFDAEVENLSQAAQEYVEEFNRYKKKLSRQYQVDLPAITFPKWIFEMSLYIDYKLDRYFKESTYTTDVNVAERKLERMFQEFIDYTKKDIGEVKQALHKKITLQNMICDEYKEQQKQQVIENRCLQTKMKALTKKSEKANKEWQEDIERSRKLDLFLMEGFIEQSAIYKGLLLDQRTAKTDRWVIHQYWNLLKIQARRIIDYDY